MTIPPTPTTGTPKQAPRERLPKRRGDSGLTTLEWLLIVAAVAGLAALAVVLVQRVVSDTSDQIAGSSARKTAAQVAGLGVQDEAVNYDSSKDQFKDWTKWDNYYTSKCNRISVTYSDAGVTATPAFAKALNSAISFVTDAHTAGASAGSAQAWCQVN